MLRAMSTVQAAQTPRPGAAGCTTTWTGCSRGTRLLARSLPRCRPVPIFIYICFNIFFLFLICQMRIRRGLSAGAEVCLLQASRLHGCQQVFCYCAAGFGRGAPTVPGRALRGCWRQRPLSCTAPYPVGCGMGRRRVPHSMHATLPRRRHPPAHPSTPPNPPPPTTRRFKPIPKHPQTNDCSPRQVELYAEFELGRLLHFLMLSPSYPLDHAYEVGWGGPRRLADLREITRGSVGG